MPSAACNQFPCRSPKWKRAWCDSTPWATRLTALAGLDDGEFDFSRTPALGGPITDGGVELAALNTSSPSQRAQLAPSSLASEMGDLEARIADREQQLMDAAVGTVQSPATERHFPVRPTHQEGLDVFRLRPAQDPFTGQQMWHGGVDFAFGFDYLRDNMKPEAFAVRASWVARRWYHCEGIAEMRTGQLRHRRRGGLHPDRRGAHAADHLRPGRGQPPSVRRHRQGDTTCATGLAPSSDAIVDERLRGRRERRIR